MMLVCWGSVCQQGLLGPDLESAAGQVVEMLGVEGKEDDPMDVFAARALLEDWVLNLKKR